MPWKREIFSFTLQHQKLLRPTHGASWSRTSSPTALNPKSQWSCYQVTMWYWKARTWRLWIFWNFSTNTSRLCPYLNLKLEVIQGSRTRRRRDGRTNIRLNQEASTEECTYKFARSAIARLYIGYFFNDKEEIGWAIKYLWWDRAYSKQTNFLLSLRSRKTTENLSPETRLHFDCSQHLSVKQEKKGSEIFSVVQLRLVDLARNWFNFLVEKQIHP